jgi:septum formation protein
MISCTEIVLASASPRRSELLRSAGVLFLVRPGEVSEESKSGESPEEHALRLACEKAREASASGAGRFYIGADTIVVCDGEIMGKPAGEDDAKRMLKKLSGSWHRVITGFSVQCTMTGREISDVVTTKVCFKELSQTEIERYVAGGCPMDKAGAYAIQGEAAYMIRRIEGSYTNVVGLPLCETVEALRAIGALE